MRELLLAMSVIVGNMTAVIAQYNTVYIIEALSWDESKNHQMNKFKI